MVDVAVIAVAVAVVAVAVVRAAHVEAVATAKEVRVVIAEAVTATVDLAAITAGTMVVHVATNAATKMEPAVAIAIKTTVGAVGKDESEWTVSNALVESDRNIIDGSIVSAAGSFA